MHKGKLCVALLLSGIIVLLSNNNGSSLEVDVSEIKTKPVKFINYKGEYPKIDSKKDIERIGEFLAFKFADNKKLRFHLKYSILHAVSKAEPEKYSAAIFSIEKDAKVGHIDVVRRIIFAYLMNKYGYSRRDAKAISLFLTYYNATYRGNIDYFSSKYKTVVMKHINKENCGISNRYDEWAGSTAMLIPLTEDSAKGSISPDIIADEKTIEQVRKDDGNISTRKDMADIKERSIKKDKKEIEDQKQKLAEKTDRIEKEKQPIEKKKQELAKKEETLKQEKEEVKKITDPEKRKEEEKKISEKEEKVKEEKDQINKKEKELEKNVEELKKEKEKIIDKEEKVQEKEEKLAKEKDQIEKDELQRDIEEEPEKAREKLKAKAEELDKREDKLRDKELEENIYADKFYYLKIKEYLEGGHYNNEMYMIDAKSRKIIFKSPVENICGSRYDIFSGGVVVITHRGNHTQGHNLTILDRDTLDRKATGNQNIFWRSFVEIRDGFIYVIIYEKGKHYLGRFDTDLSLVAKSNIEVDEDTFISFYDNFIYINRIDKIIVVLNKDDLSMIDEIKP
ncbi:MAG: hypothetical protein JW864_00865 [Spirochaetes bacterium]|nr:hypothetical protein [Spirochaetota bacterium]